MIFEISDLNKLFNGPSTSLIWSWILKNSRLLVCLRSWEDHDDEVSDEFLEWRFWFHLLNQPLSRSLNQTILTTYHQTICFRTDQMSWRDLKSLWVDHEFWEFDIIDLSKISDRIWRSTDKSCGRNTETSDFTRKYICPTDCVTKQSQNGSSRCLFSAKSRKSLRNDESDHEFWGLWDQRSVWDTGENMTINCPRNIPKHTSDFTRKINHYLDQGTKQKSEQIREISASQRTIIL